MNRIERIRRRSFQVLERAQPGDTLSAAFDIAILLLVAINVVSLMLDSVDAFSMRYSALLEGIELVSVVIFTIEYFMRLWVSVEAPMEAGNARKRIAYAFSFMALIDLFSILPFYLTFLPVSLQFLRAIKIIRVFRVLKIGRYSNSLGTIIRVFRKKRSQLFISLLIIFLMLIVVSNIMYEIEHRVQPDVFSNSFRAMWWGIVTLTGVGYGDMVPMTGLGRFIGGLIALLGLITIAMPIAILGAAYVEDAENKRRGRIQTVNTADHVIVCGYSNTTRSIVESLQDEKAVAKILIVTQKPNPEIPGAVYVHADWSDFEVLERLSLSECAAVILTAENYSQRSDDDDIDVIDMRVLFTLYNIKKHYPEVHTISELINLDHLPMIRNRLKGDEIILKEVIDGNLIASCIKIPGVSKLIYELINLEGKVIRETSLAELKLGHRCLYWDVVAHGIDHDIAFLGYISGEDATSHLAPDNDESITESDRLIYLAHR
jgi:voltage-gated potassium channel